MFYVCNKSFNEKLILKNHKNGNVSLERYERNESISTKMDRLEKEKIFGKYEIGSYTCFKSSKEL